MGAGAARGGAALRLRGAALRFVIAGTGEMLSLVPQAASRGRPCGLCLSTHTTHTLAHSHLAMSHSAARAAASQLNALWGGDQEVRVDVERVERAAPPAPPAAGAPRSSSSNSDNASPVVAPSVSPLHAVTAAAAGAQPSEALDDAPVTMAATSERGRAGPDAWRAPKRPIVGAVSKTHAVNLLEQLIPLGSGRFGKTRVAREDARETRLFAPPRGNPETVRSILGTAEQQSGGPRAEQIEALHRATWTPGAQQAHEAKHRMQREEMLHSLSEKRIHRAKYSTAILDACVEHSHAFDEAAP